MNARLLDARGVVARATGYVVRTYGESLVATLPGARVGDGVRVYAASGAAIAGEVAAIERGRVSIVPFGELTGVAVGDRVEAVPGARSLPLGYPALGRAIDASCASLDGGPALSAAIARPTIAAPEPATRSAVDRPFWTGVRAIDGLLTIGRGARVGIFGAAGAGKTTLIETIARGASGDAVVLALVGERGREAQRWFERLDRRTTIVCATSDRSASERARAAEVAMAQAERLRASGMHVVLILDSLARYASALRERSVTLGEPVGRGGYPASVWAAVARLLERAGTARRGSITLLATVLSEGADERDTVSENTRSLLDGHIVLSQELARANHYPAIDLLASASRTMNDVVTGVHERDAGRVREALAHLERTRDARSVGLARLDDPVLARAVASEGAITAFLRQRDPVAPALVRASLASLAQMLVVGA
jgi:type III secretion protein N (ATPase)